MTDDPVIDLPSSFKNKEYKYKRMKKLKKLKSVSSK